MKCIVIISLSLPLGTAYTTNPNAMDTMKENTIFTNVAETSDGGYFWEGLEKEHPKGVSITSWLGEKNWTKESGKPSSHPNSRYGHYSLHPTLIPGMVTIHFIPP